MLAYVLLGLTLLHAGRSAVFDADPKRNWVVLVAGSRGWYNYRHQADVCHAYQILLRNHIPRTNIITFMYDDIAWHRDNPFPGKIFNSPAKEDVYKGVTIDYRREDVTPENFMKVLLGDENLKREGKKVLESGPNDNVFIFFTDHGAEGLIVFPDDELYAKDLNQTLTKMYALNRYKQLVLYIEACYSGSMFEDILSDKIKIYATTAANPHESSYAIFCDDPEINSCLADEYSYCWMRDSERRGGSNWSLDNQFKVVKEQTKNSHVMRYGDLGMGILPIRQFQGPRKLFDQEEEAESLPDGLDDMSVSHRTLASKAHLTVLTRRLLAAQTEEEHERARKKLHRAIQLGNLVKEIFEEIVAHTMKRFDVAKREVTKEEQLDCFKEVFQVFKKQCFTIQQVPEVATQLSNLQKLCRAGYMSESIIEVIHDVCA